MFKLDTVTKKQATKYRDVVELILTGLTATFLSEKNKRINLSNSSCKNHPCFLRNGKQISINVFYKTLMSAIKNKAVISYL